MLNNLNKKLIAQLKKDAKPSDAEIVATLVEAVTLGKIKMSVREDRFRSAKDLADEIEFSSITESSAEAKQLRTSFMRRANREGVTIASTEYWTGREWEEAEVTGGFIGNDVLSSGYEIQMLEEALSLYNNQKLDENGFVVDPFLAAA